MNADRQALTDNFYLGSPYLFAYGSNSAIEALKAYYIGERRFVVFQGGASVARMAIHIRHVYPAWRAIFVPSSSAVARIRKGSDGQSPLRVL